MLTEIRIPRRPRGRGAYGKLERRAGDFATVGVGAFVRLGEDGRIASAGIGLTGVAETPFAATDAEAPSTGRRAPEEVFREAGRGRRPAEPAGRATSADRSNTSGRWPPR